jgi:hypothetical protein
VTACGEKTYPDRKPVTFAASFMSLGEWLTLGFVRLALACYVLYAYLRMRADGRPVWNRVARIAWTVGGIAFLLHVVFAFDAFHHWSHVHAVAETARQTDEVVGWNWGGGLYVNYAFVGLWLLDLGWWWYDPAGYEARPRWIGYGVQGFFAFILFNATVVFKAGWLRFAGIAAAVLLVGIWLLHMRKGIR